MTQRKRSPKRGSIQFSALVQSHALIANADAYWQREGYQRVHARAFRRRDGTFTARLVWRCRSQLVSAATCTFEGIELA